MNAMDQGTCMLPRWPTAEAQANKGAMNGRKYSKGPMEKHRRPSTEVKSASSVRPNLTCSIIHSESQRALRSEMPKWPTQKSAQKPIHSTLGPPRHLSHRNGIPRAAHMKINAPAKTTPSLSNGTMRKSST